MKFLKIIQRCILGCSKCSRERERANFINTLKSTILDTKYILLAAIPLSEPAVKQHSYKMTRDVSQPLLRELLFRFEADEVCKLLSGWRSVPGRKTTFAAWLCFPPLGRPSNLLEHVMVPSAAAGRRATRHPRWSSSPKVTATRCQSWRAFTVCNFRTMLLHVPCGLDIGSVLSH